MGGSVGGIVNDIGTGVGAVVTGGTSLIPGSPTKKVGDVVGGALTLNPSMIKGGIGSNGYTPQQVSNAGNDPMSVLVSNGGAPLLGQIAMGVSVNDALAGYFGQSAASFPTWLSQQDQPTQDAINGVSNQLTQIQSNTNTQNATISKLVSDFPNFMQTMVPKYASIMTDATKSMMDQAIQGAAAKYAAGGQVSSGAMNEAEAKIGAQYEEDAVNYGTSLASSDWSNQYTEANALRSFQQKMLGQGASQGFSAAQAALNRTQQNNVSNVGAVNQANAASAAASNNFTSQLLGLGGTLGIRALTGGSTLPSASSGSSPSPSPAPTPFPQGDTSMNPPLYNPSSFAGSGAGGYR